MLMKQKTKFYSLALTVLLSLTVVLSGCGSNESGNANNSTNENQNSQQPSNSPEQTKPPEPLKVSSITPFYGPASMEKGSPFFEKAEEILNWEWDAQFVPGSNLMEKVNVALASGSVPDIMGIFPVNSVPFIQATRSGAFWEIGPYLNDYPNLKEGRNPIADQNISIDGKIYQLYKPEVSISTNGFNIRTDWMEKLNLEQPKTIDELTVMLRAFAKDDPDGNGNADTYGFVDRIASGGYPMSFGTMASKFGVPNKYKIEDGKFVPDFMTPEFRNVMNFYKQMYDEGIMNKDFAYIKRNQQEDLYKSGKAGVSIGNVFQNSIWDPVTSAESNVDIIPFSYLEGPTGNHNYSGLGYWITYVFSKDSVKTEEQLREILSSLDRLAAEENHQFLTFGIEGLTYEMKDGKPVFTNEELNKQAAPLRALNVSKNKFTPAANTQAYKYEMDRVRLKNEQESQYLVSDPSGGLISPTYLERGSELDKMIADAFVKYVIGEVTMDDFDQTIEDWKSNGGQKVLDEYAVEYKKLNP